MKEDISAFSADELRQRTERLQAELHATKVAYLNSTEFQNKNVSYEDLKAIAQEIIRTNYALQQIEFGSIKLRLSVAKILRRGR